MTSNADKILMCRCRRCILAKSMTRLPFLLKKTHYGEKAQVCQKYQVEKFGSRILLFIWALSVLLAFKSFRIKLISWRRCLSFHKPYFTFPLSHTCVAFISSYRFLTRTTFSQYRKPQNPSIDVYVLHKICGFEIAKGSVGYCPDSVGNEVIFVG